MQHSLAAAHSFFVGICCYYVDLCIAQLLVLWTPLLTCKTSGQKMITIQTYNRDRRKTECSGQGFMMDFVPQILLFSPGKR